MKYLLDSNIVIRLAMGAGDALRTRVAQCDEGDLVTSSIVLAEVGYGLNNRQPPVLDQLRALLEEVPVLDFDQKAAIAYATIPFRRASYGRMIAAHAISLGVTLVTDDVAQYTQMPGLRAENWLAP